MDITITPLEIDAIATQIRVSAVTILEKQLARLEEETLIRNVTETVTDPKQRVLAYLKLTNNNVQRRAQPPEEMVTVRNDYLRKTLRIKTLALKAIREELIAAGLLTVVSRKQTSMVLAYRRPAS